MTRLWGRYDNFRAAERSRAWQMDLPTRLYDWKVERERRGSWLLLYAPIGFWEDT